MTCYEFKIRLFEDVDRAAKFYQCVHYIFKTANEMGITPLEILEYVLSDFKFPVHYSIKAPRHI